MAWRMSSTCMSTNESWTPVGHAQLKKGCSGESRQRWLQPALRSLQGVWTERDDTAWMERVCQSVQYRVSWDRVRAKGWVRVPSTTVSLQGERGH
ncbi:hypothetical protein EYF80_065441 [Liparis tanakae]|uniref:Uncharacterized protein n=1 Tax=Liparis tanakae TaxID=230148 RepID=A0A4Z2E799_9TELE|nr:hypothetical protein EYF80_065441 [Liparis tanakae]